MNKNIFPSDSFAGRARALMAQRGLSSAALAKLSGLSPSWLSRLLTENDETRRKAGIDDILALARALEVTAIDLVSGTDAEAELGRWVPRESIQQEVEARHAAQLEASELRMRMAALESQIGLMLQEQARIASALVQSQEELANTKRGQLRLQLDLVAAQASQRQAEAECEQARQQAQVNYEFYVAAKEANTRAALFGGLVGVVGSAVLAEAQKPSRRRRRPTE